MSQELLSFHFFYFETPLVIIVTKVTLLYFFFLILTTRMFFHKIETHRHTIYVPHHHITTVGNQMTDNVTRALPLSPNQRIVNK